MDNNSEILWFLAQLKPNSLNIARRNLAQQGFQTFMPMQKETKRSQNKFVPQMCPLFPGYLFVAFDVLQGSWRAVNSTYGVTRLVSFGKDPTPVPSDVISQLAQRYDDSGALRVPGSFAPGDQVKVTNGPFTDFLATVESLAPDQRVFVLLDLMGARTRVEIETQQIRPRNQAPGACPGA